MQGILNCRLVDSLAGRLPVKSVVFPNVGLPKPDELLEYSH
jgi:hypothetical protein